MVYGGCVITHFAARVSLIDMLQHANCVLKPKSNTNHFGCDSLKKLGIVPLEPKKKNYMLDVETIQ